MALRICACGSYGTKITQLTDLMSHSTNETLFAGTPHLLYYNQSEAKRLINGVIIALINKNTGIDEHYEARITDLEVENNTARTDLNLLKVGL